MNITVIHNMIFNVKSFKHDLSKNSSSMLNLPFGALV